jgi:hypothetical protein
LSLTFFKRHIPEDKFHNIFSVGHPNSDISFTVVPEARSLSIEYIVGADALIVSISHHVISRENYLEYSGVLFSTTDLGNVQTFIYPNFAKPAIEGQDDEKVAIAMRAIRLQSLEINVGGNLRFDIPIKSLPSIVSEWGDDVFIYVFPA